MYKKYLNIFFSIIIFLIPFFYQFFSKRDSFKLTVSSNYKEDSIELKNGDIIFQTSLSSQSKAIQLATKSRYSHLGIIYINNGQYYVYEAIQTVTLTPLQKWINKGKDKHYVVKRLKNSEKILTPKVLNKMKIVSKKYFNKDYDLFFEWSDDRVYCSELVWKIYKQTLNIEIGDLEYLSDFDLESEIVKRKISERYGDSIPHNEKVISPAQIFNSNKLKIIKNSDNPTNPNIAK